MKYLHPDLWMRLDHLFGRLARLSSSAGEEEYMAEAMHKLYLYSTGGEPQLLEEAIADLLHVLEVKRKEELRG